MELNAAIGILEDARKKQSCYLADGLIDDLIPYWEVVEEALDNIVSDRRCAEALATVAGDEAAREVLERTHNGFFKALLGRYGRVGDAGATDGSPAPFAEDTIAADYPDVADFIAHGLYEAFEVPDAYGTFDLTVMPATCKVTGEYLNPEGDVSGYVLDNGKMLLVTRDGDAVTDVRYAEATTNNIHLVIHQSQGRPFEWDAVESPDHDKLRRDGALPGQA